MSTEKLTVCSSYNHCPLPTFSAGLPRRPLHFLVLPPHTPTPPSIPHPHDASSAKLFPGSSLSVQWLGHSGLSLPRARGPILCQGTKILQAVWCSQTQQKKTNQTNKTIPLLVRAQDQTLAPVSLFDSSLHASPPSPVPCTFSPLLRPCRRH